MAEAMAKRGPDDRGYRVFDEAALVSVRLAIQDPSPSGHMPMTDDSGRFTIVFNGEVYNFHELQEEVRSAGHVLHSGTDTETILYLYRMHGVACLQKLRGAFALAIWDDTDKVLFLARDRVGKRPLKVYSDGETLVFGSDFRSIFQDPRVKKGLNHEAIGNYLLYGYVPGQYSVYEHCWKLPPGHYMTISRDGQKTESYWSLEFTPKSVLPEAEVISTIQRTIREAVELRLVADVEIALMLSGGVDSSVVAAVLSQELGRPLNAFSVGFDGRRNELPIARVTAKRYGLELQELFIEPAACVERLEDAVRAYDEPFGDSSALPSYLISAEIRKHVSVAMNGDGGDEAFAGYSEMRTMRLNHRVRHLRSTLRLLQPCVRRLHPRLGRIVDILGSDPALAYYYYTNGYESARQARLHVASANDIHVARAAFGDTRDASDLDTLLAYEYRFRLTDRLMVKMDMAAMGNSVETRSPLLDQEVVSLAARLPAHLKIRDGVGKWALREAYRHLLPDEVLAQKKMGFVLPMEGWMRNELRSRVEATAKPDSFCSVFMPVDRIREAIAGNDAGAGAWGPLLWNLVMLEAWKSSVYDEL